METASTIGFLLSAALLAHKASEPEDDHEGRVDKPRKAGRPFSKMLDESLPYVIVTAYTLVAEWKFASKSGMKMSGPVDMLLYAVAYFSIEDLWFYGWHRACHEVPWLFEHVHRHHHVSHKNRNMEPFDFLRQHPLDFLMASAPIAFFPHILPVVPMWFHLYLTGTIGFLDFAGHCQDDIRIDATIFGKFVLLCTSPVHLANLIIRKTTGLYAFHNARQHRRHHDSYKDNYGQTVRTWDYFFGTLWTGRDAGKEAPKRYAANALVCVLQLYAMRYGSVEMSMAVYTLVVACELAFYKIHPSLKYGHHPLFLAAAALCYAYRLENLMTYYVLSNVLQLPTYLALHNGSGYKKAAVWALVVKTALLILLLMKETNVAVSVIACFGFVWQIQGAWKLYTRTDRVKVSTAPLPKDKESTK